MATLATLLAGAVAAFVGVPCYASSAELPAADEALAQAESASEPARPRYSLWGVASESLLGEHRERWRPLSVGTFFSEGWDQPWVAPPRGGGGAPRQSWLNAFNGAFYRSFHIIGGWIHHDNDAYDGAFSIDTPLNARTELTWTIPYVDSTVDARGNRHTGVGDFTLNTRFLLSETRDATQSFNVTFRMPTGHLDNGNDVASIEPAYEFWANWWRGLVVRGGVGLAAPYNHDGVRNAGARTTVLGNVSAGYYVTPHDLAPIGDLVWYVSANLTTLTDGRGPNTTTLTFTPGFRTYLGGKLYLFGGVELPATEPKPFDYQVLAELLMEY
jgi:hypothetical protein